MPAGFAPLVPEFIAADASDGDLPEHFNLLHPAHIEIHVDHVGPASADGKRKLLTFAAAREKQAGPESYGARATSQRPVSIFHDLKLVSSIHAAGKGGMLRLRFGQANHHPLKPYSHRILGHGVEVPQAVCCQAQVRPSLNARLVDPPPPQSLAKNLKDVEHDEQGRDYAGEKHRTIAGRPERYGCPGQSSNRNRRRSPDQDSSG